MTSGTQRKVIGVREAASMLCVHENTVRNWTKAGILIDARHPGTRQLRLSREQVEQMAAGLPSPIAPDVVKAHQQGYRQGRNDVLREIRRFLRDFS